MCKRIYSAFLFLVLFILTVHDIWAQNMHSQTSLYPTYNGLVMAGYQGQFRAAGDGSL
jgi:hypothetical protein